MTDTLSNAPLGKKSAYIAHYDPHLLFSIPREEKRCELGILSRALPFYGFDTWNAFEVSWLNSKGKPEVAIAQIDIACDSSHIIESKSFKLYLNSFNQTSFASSQAVRAVIEKDIQRAVQGNVKVTLFALSAFSKQTIENFSGQCIDDLDIEITDYDIRTDYLSADPSDLTEEILHSHLLKSNCLVTGQPDWGSVEIHYKGAKINAEGLLKYLISFRNHNEFHEQCVERIFMDVMTHCQPEMLTVHARYTRRGGLDINPIRSTALIEPSKNIRMARQ